MAKKRKTSIIVPALVIGGIWFLFFTDKKPQRENPPPRYTGGAGKPNIQPSKQAPVTTPVTAAVAGQL